MKPLIKTKPTPKPLIPAPSGASKAPFVKRAKVAPIDAYGKPKLHTPIKGNYDNGPVNKGDVIRLANAAGTKIAPDALVGSKKFANARGI